MITNTETEEDQRLAALWLASHGLSARTVAEHLRANEKQVKEWLSSSVYQTNAGGAESC